MAKADQHFVPRVYLRRWSPNHSDQVYYFSKEDINNGQPRNVATILFARHTYTITFDDYFILDQLPQIKADFEHQINDILSRYSAIPFYDGRVLERSLLASPRTLAHIDQWDFRKTENPEQLASRRGILSNIKGIHSYILEEKLDQYVETKWNALLDTFLAQVEQGQRLRISDRDIVVDSSIMDALVSMLLIFMCRNPSFDFQGVFPKVKELLSSVFLSAAQDDSQAADIQELISEQMRGAWLSQLYSALFNDDKGGFHSEYLKKIKGRCQATIIHCKPKEGSFITTDVPSFAFACNVMISNFNAIYFPLTPEYLLLIGKGQNNSLNKLDYKTVTNKGLRRFNSIILSQASKGIISNQKHLGCLL